MKIRLAIFLIWVAAPIAILQLPPAIAASPQQAGQRFTPTAAYQRESIQGFTILINPAVLQHQQETGEMRQELNRQLAAIARVVPAQPLSVLKKVRIWIEWAKQPQEAATFHPSAQWLSQHGYNPEKAGCVEVSNTRHLIQWSQSAQPWMMLHELAHAYQHHVLGNENANVNAAYQHALNQKLYISVPYILGGKQKAYALTNAKEYFAELSEAYFGKNDFFPFTRAELKAYDPVGYRLMETSWGKPRSSNGTI